jgi:predicted 3-demethylubiquinone-9 3-methyltransferase (glyoxalase superfamily)
MPQKIVPNLWFDTEAEEAAQSLTTQRPGRGPRAR